jgi:nucleoside-diphosphate-sugar epimerase
VTSVLLTGATGTIGSALVPRLLRDRGTSVSLLIRSRDENDLLTRFVGMLDYWGYAPGDQDATRLRPVRGDITMPAFGLGAQDLAIVEQTTHIIHCAASVKLNMSPAHAHATAVAPIRTCARARATICGRGHAAQDRRSQHGGCLGPNTRRHARTAASGGARIPQHLRSGQSGSRAGDLGPRPNDFRSLCIVPAWWSENVEPGRVIHFQVFYHLCEFLSGIRTLGLMPDLGATRLDTVPVDWVADAICWSCGDVSTAGRIFHLCSGPSAAIALPRLQEHVRRIWGERGRQLPRLREIDRRALERLARVLGVFLGRKGRRALRGLPPVLAYLAERQGFSNDETSRALSEAGLPVPAIESYLDEVLGYYLDAKGTRSSA